MIYFIAHNEFSRFALHPGLKYSHLNHIKFNDYLTKKLDKKTSLTTIDEKKKLESKDGRGKINASSSG